MTYWAPVTLVIDEIYFKTMMRLETENKTRQGQGKVTTAYRVNKYNTRIYLIK